MTSRRRIDKGFTLLELAVVLVIVAILAAGVVPALLRAMTRTHLRSSAWQVASQLSFARAHAVNKQLLCRVRFDPDELAFLAEVEQDPEETPGEFAAIEVPAMDHVALPEDFVDVQMQTVSMTTPQSTEVVYFQPNGRTDGVDVFLESLDDMAFTVSVSPNTGQVRVTEGVL